MKKIILFLLISTSTAALPGQNNKQQFVATDIANFWVAYDKMITTTDTIQQYKILQEDYLGKASEGLNHLIENKRYTNDEYLTAIVSYPEFWKSIRANSLKTNVVETEIETEIQKLKTIYPDLKPSTIYFSMGAFRSNGTIKGNNVLISCEMALTDQNVNTSELPENLQNYYKLYKPLATIALLATHEYVHTQQKLPLDNLLCNTLYEGVAEFVSCLATNKPSTTPSFGFGKQNEALVKETYIKELFLPDRMYNWMWGQNRNELKERDLGYYVGYRICESYYNRSKDKKKAIKEMIGLDYSDDKAVERFVDQSGFFSKSIKMIHADYEKRRPTVISITPFENGNKKVKPGRTTITVQFSKPLDKGRTGIDFGPLGESSCPKIMPERAWSEDGKSWTFTAELKPNQHYQILISNNFRLETGERLKPYLIDIRTTD